jgi:hypothetical protein
MAIMSNSQNTYAQIGIREDLANMVYRIDPEETPFQSNIATNGTAANTNHEWQTQALAAQATNYQLEGDDAPAAEAATARVRLKNYCNISRKVIAVTGTGRAVEVAGVSDELNEQRLLRSLELKRDMEVTLLANQAYDAGSTLTARRTAGLPAYITNYDSTSFSAAAGYSASSGTGSVAWSLSNALTLSLSILNSTMQAAYIDGGKPRMLMLSAGGQTSFSNMALTTTLNGAVQVRYNQPNIGATALIGAVEKWQSNFGGIDVTPNVQMSYDSGAGNTLNRMMFLVDPRYAKVAFLRKFQSTPLAKTGDNDKELLIAEYCLEVSAPNAHALVPRVTVAT